MICEMRGKIVFNGEDANWSYILNEVVIISEVNLKLIPHFSIFYWLV